MSASHNLSKSTYPWSLQNCQLWGLDFTFTTCCWLAGRVLGGEEVLQLPKKSEELVPGTSLTVLVPMQQTTGPLPLSPH